MAKEINVLVVGANLADLQNIERELNKNFSTFIKIVETETEFEQAISSDFIDIIIADYHLPYFSGVLALSIRQAKAPLIPFIFITNFMNEEIAVKCIQAGADDYLIKENLNRLGVAAESAIEKKQLELFKVKAVTDLRNSKETFLNIFNNSVVAIYILDSDGRFIDINKAVLQCTGQSKSSLIGKSIDFIAAEGKNDLRIIRNYLKQSYEKDTQNFEFWVKDANGKAIPQMINTQIGKYFEQSAIFAFAFDITIHKKYEQELKLSEEKYKTIFENSNVAKSITLPNGKFTPNPAFCELVGYTNEELENKTWKEITPQEDIESVLEIITPLLNGEKDSVRFTKRYVHKNGKIIWTDLSSRIIRDELGSLQFFISTILDITEKTNAEKLIEKNNERLQKLLEIYEYNPASNLQDFLDFSLSKAIELTESKIGYIYSYNEADEKFTLNSWSKDVMVECKIVNPQTCYELNKTGFWAEAVRQRKEIVLNDFQSSNPFKKGYPEGHVELKKYLTLPVFDNKRIVAVIGVANKESDYDQNDILQLKLLINSVWKVAIRKEIELENLKLINAVEHSPLSIMVANYDGDIEYVNPKFVEVTGYQIDFVKRKNPNILKSGRQSDEFYKNLWDTIKSGREWKGEFYNKKKSGEYYWEAAAISPIFNKNKEITHFVAIKEDITERKNMLEELLNAKTRAENADKLKSEFLAQISHEIRTPINSMLGNINIIHDFGSHEFIDSIKDVFISINSASRRLIRTIDLILNISEVQLGTYQPIFYEIDISKSILNPLMNDFSSAVAIKNLQMSYENTSSSSVIKGDFYSIQQIFSNIIDNAIKYTDKGNISITLADDGQNGLTAEVKDTGVGISKEYYEKMFKPFSQETSGYNRKYEGNGLGLSLVKKYCEINNASIEVQSEKNSGTSIKITFFK